jgi:colicin import membrane protein
MRTGLTISGVGHAVVLLWCVVTFIVQPYHAEPMKGLPVDLVSAAEFSQMTDGPKNAPRVEKPKPLAEKVAEATPVADPTAKLAKTEVKAATDVRAPEPKPPEPKVKKPPQPPAPSDPIAEALKKDEVKKPEPKKPDPKPPTPPKKPAQQEPAPPQFDPRQVAALLNKRDPQRVAIASNEMNHAVSVGVSGGAGGPPPLAGDPAGQLSQRELAAMKMRLMELWNPPRGATPREATLEVEIQLKPDGTLAAPPVVLTSGNSPLFVAASDSAKRAVIQGAPYTMLEPAHYEIWRDFVITFDPQFIGGN